MDEPAVNRLLLAASDSAKTLSKVLNSSPLMKSHFFYCSLALVLTATLASADTITIDFTGIPDGTPLSANNPYGGVVNLQAQSGYSYGIVDPSVPYGIGGGEVWTQTGVITSGWPSDSGNIAFVNSAPGSILPAGAWALRSMTSLTATFLVPVTEVSFTTLVASYWPYGFDYQGVDRNGVAFSGTGVVEYPHQWATTVVDVPNGGYFTQLQISNWEDSFMLNDGTPAGGGIQALKSMTLEFSNEVPEPSSLGDKALLLFVAAIAPLMRWRRPYLNMFVR
jgi:hypothetical protein